MISHETLLSYIKNVIRETLNEDVCRETSLFNKIQK